MPSVELQLAPHQGAGFYSNTWLTDPQYQTLRHISWSNSRAKLRTWCGSDVWKLSSVQMENRCKMTFSTSSCVPHVVLVFGGWSLKCLSLISTNLCVSLFCRADGSRTDNLHIIERWSLKIQIRGPPGSQLARGKASILTHKTPLDYGSTRAHILLDGSLKENKCKWMWEKAALLNPQVITNRVS